MEQAFNVRGSSYKIIFSLDNAILFIFILLLNFQWLGIEGWVEGPINGGNSVKIYHIFIVAFASYLLFKGSLGFTIPLPVFLFLSFSVLWSSIAYFFFPVNKLIFHYSFALFLFFCAYHFQKTLLLSYSHLSLKVINNVYLLLYFLVCIKYIVYSDVIFTFLKNPNGHPIIPTFYGGGINLEATWIAMSTIFFIRRKVIFYFAITFSLLISISYSSRVGLVLTLTSFGLYFISEHISKREKRIFWLAALACVIMFLTFSIYLFKDLYVLERFTQIGSEADKGSMGRFLLWENIFEASFQNNLLGYGAGNGLYAIEKIGTVDFTEDNVHNYYLQVLLEFGALGLLIYLFIPAKVLLYQIRNRFFSEYGNFLLLYFLASLIQFRGAEPLMWLIAGFFFASLNIKRFPYFK